MTGLMNSYLFLVRWLELAGGSALALVFRLWLAQVFFASGLTKIKSWESTLLLFEYEYSVPVLSPTLAAWLATAGELALPVMLVFGLGTRFAAAGLFIMNAVAAISYPDISPAGMKDHLVWGAMALTVFVYGGGKIALDAWLIRRYA